MSVVVLDYGSGNLHSVVHGLAAVGADVRLSADPGEALRADGLVVPGVGAYPACMAQLRAVGGDSVIRERVRAGRPVLGICVGHQILFAAGVEHGCRTAGVGVYPGVVRALPTPRLPHMGWNTVVPDRAGRYLAAGERYYFVHSYAALEASDLPDDAVVGWTTHDGVRFVAAAEWGPVLTTQFHPEKSGRAGLALLAAWVEALSR